MKTVSVIEPEPLERVREAEAREHVERRQEHRDERADEQVLEPRALDACLGGVHLAPQHGEHRGEAADDVDRDEELRGLHVDERRRGHDDPGEGAREHGVPGAPRGSARHAEELEEEGERRGRDQAARGDREPLPPGDAERLRPAQEEAREREQEEIRGEDREEREDPGAVVAQERRHGEGERHDRGEQRRLGADVHAGEILDGFRAGCPPPNRPPVPAVRAGGGVAPRPQPGGPLTRPRRDPHSLPRPP